MFLIVGDGRAIDVDLQFLQKLARLLDDQLGQVEEEEARIEDPDGFGVYDSAEYLIGLGFVACQGYQTATYGCLGVKKQEALKAAPVHRCGCTIAALINHAANFWKHHEEWSLDTDTPAETRTMDALAALGSEGSDFPLTGALTALVLPTRNRIQALVSHLEAWRDALAGAA